MSIASEFDSTIENIKSDYEGLENIGADLTNIDKNIYNIRTCLDNIYSNIPKTTGEGSNLSLSTIKGRINVDDILGDTQQAILPSAYQQVEYIESTGPAYIDTGVIPNTNTKIDIQFETIKKGTYGVIFGGEEAFGTNAFHLYTNKNNFDIGFGARYTAENIPYNLNTKYTLVMDKTGLTIDDTTGTFSSNTIATTNSVYLFAVHRATNVIDSDAQKRIYYCKLYNNGTLVRNMIPCYRVSDNVIGMYDLVSNTFLTNAGTGTFTKGSNAPTPSSPQDIEVVTGQQEVVVSNKNKLPSGESGTYTSSGATHTSNGKGVYTINGTATGTSFHNFQIAPYTIKSGDYLYLGNSTANGNVAIALLVSGSEQIMFRSCSTANAIQDLSSYAGKVVNYVRTFTNAQTLSNFELKPMICNLSTQTDYVEHQEQTKTLHLGDIELAKIGTYQDRIFETSGKNLYDSNNVIENALIQPSLNKIGATTECTTIWFKCTPNTTYTLSRDKGDRLVIGGSNTQPALNGEITTLYDVGASEDKTYTFNSGNFEYVAIYISRYNSSKPTIIMLNYGSTALPYEPYGSDKWYIEKNIGKYTINGASGTFSKPSTNRFNIDGAFTDYLKAINTITCIADKYVSYAQKGSNADFNTLVANENFGLDLSSSASAFTIRIKDTNYDDINQYKTWLGNNNVELLYVLATPTYTEITNETLLNELNELEKMMSYNGTTNISVSGNLPMILNVSALKGE